MKRIKQLRLDRGLTQAQLAAAIDASQIDISQWERGATPNAATLEKIARFFDVGADELMTEKERRERLEKDSLRKGERLPTP